MNFHIGHYEDGEAIDGYERDRPARIISSTVKAYYTPDYRVVHASRYTEPGTGNRAARVELRDYRAVGDRRFDYPVVTLYFDII